MSDLPTPINRHEQYLNAIANGTTDNLPTPPITREEVFLDYIARNGGGSGGGDVTGVKGNAESEYRKGNVNITPANIGLGNVDNTSDLNKPVSTAQQTALAGKVSISSVGSANGVAELDANGRVPSSQLPSYVDDVLEYADLAHFPATGESGKIYIAEDTNKTYRWSGSGYAEISESLALGETSSTAYAGNKGKANADAIAAIKDGTNIDSFGDVETALSGKVDKVTGKGLSTNDYDDTAKGIVDGVTTVNDITSQCTVDTTKVNEFKAFTIGKLLYISLKVNKNATDQSTVVSGLPRIYGIPSGYGVLSMFFMNSVDANTNATCVITNGLTSARIEFRCGSNLTGDDGMIFSGMFIMI